MTSFTAFLVVYVLGGITFIPAVVALIFTVAYYTFPEAVIPPKQLPLQREGEEDVFTSTDDEKNVRRLTNSVDDAEGYFLVTREFVPGGVNGKAPERASPAGSTTPSPSTNSPSVYQSMYRSLFDRKSNIGATDSPNGQKVRRKRADNEFYVVLRHGHLMLYDDEQQMEVRFVISLEMYTVSIYGGGEVIPEGELYIRRNAICLTRRKGLPDVTSVDPDSALPIYLFSENCSNKEDFYLALVNKQKRTKGDPSIPPRPLDWHQKDIIKLVKGLHSSEDQLAMNWLNGLAGRMFLSVYRTPEVEQFIRAKIVKKLTRVAKPSFLTDINIQHIYVGDSVPSLTNPRMRDMNSAGDFVCEFDISYSGNFRLEIATKATLNLGARFKTREVDLILAILLKRLDGHCVIRMKPPPSNRLWFAFEKMPKMELIIEPIVGSRQVAWGPILRVIENRIREVIEESVVLPYYDDIPFTDTIDQKFRGGIWHTEKKTPPRTHAPKPSVDSEGQSIDVAEPVTGDPTIDEDGILSPPEPGSPPELPPRDTPPINAPLVSVEEEADTQTIDVPTRSSARLFNSITPTPPAPSILTDAINVTAHRDRTESSPANPSISSHNRSRSSSSPHPPSPISIQTPRRKKSSSIAKPESFPADSSASSISSGSTSYPTAFGSSTTSFGSSGPTGFGNAFVPPSRSSTISSAAAAAKNPLQTIAAVGTAAAAVKNWYTNRKVSGPGSVPRPIIPTSTPTAPTTRPLPPAVIPPPPARRQSKTDPIPVPKRKPLPPPLQTAPIPQVPQQQQQHQQQQPPQLPAREKRDSRTPPELPMRHREPPALPPREEVLVVAAPRSYEEEEEEGFLDEELWRGVTNGTPEMRAGMGGMGMSTEQGLGRRKAWSAGD
ncbi:putative integral membrane protein conserved region-domain-containing protein [Pyronema omphalodes]|nr:putative integral membrane protein conserved region-domain-containing protein [Pyronema omphalodes]